MLPGSSKGFIPIIALIVGAVLALVTTGGVVYYIAVLSPSSASIKTAQRPMGFSIPTPAAEPVSTSTVQQTTQQSTEFQPQEILPSPTPDITQLMYNNVEAGYIFKYPFGWTVVEGSTACGTVFYPPDTEKVSLTICGLNAGTDDLPAAIAERAIGSSLSSLISKSSILVDKHDAVRQETSITSGQYEIDVFVGNVSSKSKALKGTLAIYFSIQDSAKISKMQKEFDMILSTFKFTN